MHKRFGIVALFVFLAGAFVQAEALEIRGVEIPPEQTVAGQTLVLNGAGVRKHFVFDVYVGAMYLPKKTSDPEEIFNMKGPIRITMDLLRDTNREDTLQAQNDGFHNNLTPAELQRHSSQIEQFAQAAAGGRKGVQSIVDLIPGKGTVIMTDNGKTVLGVVPGDDFFHAVLKLWIGHTPNDPKLKQSLLGL